MQKTFRHLIQTRPLFDPHLGEGAILRGLSDGTVHRGELLVSHHNNAKGKVVLTNSERMNCNGFFNRNRALSGDKVYVKRAEKESSMSSSSESIASDNEEPVSVDDLSNLSGSTDICRVVAIEKRSGKRFVSRSRPGEDLVQPRDPRFPAMRLSPRLKGPEYWLALVKFKQWEDNEQYPSCDLIRLLGKEGHFDAEDDASLEIHGLSSDAYSEECERELKMLFPNAESVVARELTRRTDRRLERVFSIDPPTAKDLDDAISVEKISTGEYKIGVHVADVSYFVKPDTSLDNQARERATSVYLPRRVYPMLPAYLSENLCSLLPGSDRLAFSVYFSLNEEGQMIGGPEIERTVIRSRAQLSYDDVDAALSGDAQAMTSISTDIIADIRCLMALTAKLRSERISNGSISIDERNNEHIKFEFFDMKGMESFPVRIYVDKSSWSGMQHDSHTLIEELMVLTNKIVANKLVDNHSLTLPVVRRHMDTEDSVIDAARKFLSTAGVGTTDSDSLTSILVLAKTKLSPSLFSAFTHSIMGEFNRAEYVAAPGGQSQAHWGVGTHRYMHFTSPIRRYADLIVHRKIASIMNLSPMDPPDPDEIVVEQIKRCNRNSRAAQQAESDNELFYFGTFVKSFGNVGFPIEGIVKDLIVPNEERNVKGSVSFFLPLIGEIRSQSLESMGLTLIDHETEKTSGQISMMNARDRNGNERTFKPLDAVKVRAYVKNASGPLPKIHLRMDKIPNPPPPR
jgi:VacB/RNase II family 3'-5' exoribonuclease